MPFARTHRECELIVGVIVRRQIQQNATALPQLQRLVIVAAAAGCSRGRARVNEGGNAAVGVDAQKPV